MKFSSLSLETAYFEDYLCFFTEVLELELLELTDEYFRVDLQGITLLMKKNPKASFCSMNRLEFILEEEDYEALMKKVSFFYYRREDSRFVLASTNPENLLLADPDGRIWSFSSMSENKSSSEFVRNY